MPSRALLANLSTRGKISSSRVGALAIVIVLFVLFRIATAPSYTTVLTGMDPKQTGEVTAALDTRGITYELQNNGTALAVQKEQTADARIALATAGVPASTQDGYKILDDQKLGTSNFQQQVNYQRALEGEIAADDRAGRRRHRRPGAARAARQRGAAVRREHQPGDRRRAAVRHQRPRRGPGARDRAARHQLRPRPQDRQGHDHRQLERHDAVAERHQRRRRPAARRRSRRSRRATTRRPPPT